MAYNGPAVGFSKRYPTPAPLQCCPDRLQNCPGARRVWHVFLQSRYKVLIEGWRDRGTKWIGTAILSPVTKLIAGTGAVSR
jgi:hypothetical protein